MADQEMTASLKQREYALYHLAFGIEVEINHHIAQKNQIELAHHRQLFAQVELHEIHPAAQIALHQQGACLRTDSFQAIARQMLMRNAAGALQRIAPGAPLVANPRADI